MAQRDLIEFTKHLKLIFGGDGSVREFPSNDSDLGPVYTYVFHDYPDQDLRTIVTYGLSATAHSHWHFGRPELILCVDSTDEKWTDSLAHIIHEFRGEKSFSPGSVYELDGRISDDSWMNGFVIFTPSFLKAEQRSFQLPSKLIYFSQAYPLYQGEAKMIREKGFEEFWSHKGLVDVYDVKREDVSIAY